MSVLDLSDYHELGGIFFSKKDLKKISHLDGQVTILSNVCPDYPNDGNQYTFYGELGSGIGLTAKEHLKRVPFLNDALREIGLESIWLILVADLPELVKSQQEFYERVAGTKEEYLRRCQSSVEAIQDVVRNEAVVETFSSFYEKRDIAYLKIQEEVVDNVLKRVDDDRGFSVRFSSFMIERSALSEKFRGKRLSSQEHKIAAAHGMSLYITHGTLLRSLFPKGDLIVVNHSTLNLKHFFMCEMVNGYKHFIDAPRFVLGIINRELY